MDNPTESSNRKIAFLAVCIGFMVFVAVVMHLADSEKGGPCGAKASIFGTRIKCEEGLKCRFGKCETPTSPPAYGCRIFQKKRGKKNPDSYAFDESDAESVEAARKLAIGLYRTRHPGVTNIDGNCYVCGEYLKDAESRSICGLDE